MKSPPLITAQQARAWDKQAREKFAVSTLVLMENAGRAVAHEALKVLKNKPKTIAVFCGKGNNAGDGFVAARHLLTSGIKCDIFLAGGIEDIGNEAKINLEILMRLREKIIEVGQNNLEKIRRGIIRARYSLVIDAILGVGLSGEVRGVCRDLIGIINSSKAYTLSVDIPSGLDATIGKILGCCVKADKTVTFVAKKRGMVLADGPKYCGRIVVRDLGIPSQNLLKA
ncbi:MAG: NAD(P)H-hydrate epimerase [Candidatus Omnitrophica bacterium]|nr:NAD(P)H-hydrate epimerase [Candidatus Omnitrophota bacterium]MCG2706351.1 NAD(P)H-hydrate epimerase [Candidatus Omnitrophota bacterium]